jgi:pimeloyl-ACP methyl ester carboxylesterase
VSDPDEVRLYRPDAAHVAYHYMPGCLPVVVFLGGLRSDMSGIKALYLERWCRHRGQAFLRLDYRGHGASGGSFEALGISDWLADVQCLLKACAIEAPVVVGSSMGAWLGLLLATDSATPLHGLVTLAGAADFTECLLWPRLNARQRAEIVHDGVTHVPSRYGDGPYPISRRLIEDGRQHQLLNAPLTLACPIRIIHGTCDPDVPPAHSVRLFEHVHAPHATLTLLQGGDHRLSTPAALDEITMAIEALVDDAPVPHKDE